MTNSSTAGTNVEIKARVSDWEELHARVRQACRTEGEIIRQVDTFFTVPVGRLKLRVFSEDRGELIHYFRMDSAGPRVSEYRIFHTEHPDSLLRILTSSLGIRGIVSKTRLLFMLGQTRIHLDDVHGIGRFVELEVVLGAGQRRSEGEKIAREVMNVIGIAESDLVKNAYIDLLQDQSARNRGRLSNHQ